MISICGHVKQINVRAQSEKITFVDWSVFGREVCENFLGNNYQELGGYDDNFESKTVEIG